MAGTDRTQKDISAAGPVIILAEPQLAENIGMAARAMANFGLARLRLICPRESLPNAKATAAASKADHILRQAEIFATVEEALADLHYVLATTARRRDGFKPVLSAVEAARALRARQSAVLPPETGGAAGEGAESGAAPAAQGEQTGILFGRERFGLSNAELSLADALVTFPVNPAFASLNLAQAVLLMAYEWHKSGLEAETDTLFRGPDFAPAPRQALYSLFHRLEAALAARGYFRPLARKPVMVDNLRAVLSRAGFSAAELRLLSGVVASLDYYPRREKAAAQAQKNGGSGRAEGQRQAEKE